MTFLDMDIFEGILISRPSGISLFTYEMTVLMAQDLSIRKNSATLKFQTKLNTVMPENICVVVSIIEMLYYISV